MYAFRKFHKQFSLMAISTKVTFIERSYTSLATYWRYSILQVLAIEFVLLAIEFIALAQKFVMTERN